MSYTASEGVDAASMLPTPPPQRPPATPPTPPMTTKQPTNPIVIPPAKQFYWVSAEAAELFVPKENEAVLEGINALTILQKANKMNVRNLNVLDEGGGGEALNKGSLTSNQVWAIQQRCLILWQD